MLYSDSISVLQANHIDLLPLIDPDHANGTGLFNESDVDSHWRRLNGSLTISTNITSPYVFLPAPVPDRRALLNYRSIQNRSYICPEELVTCFVQC